MFEAASIRKVSVIIPVFSEQGSLSGLIRRASATRKKLDKDYETLLIDDGSSDRSAQLMMDASQVPNSHIVSTSLSCSYGQHSAIAVDFSHITGDSITTPDADLQNPPEEIPWLVATADEGFDAVGTVRQNRQDSVFREIASRVINHLTQHTTGKTMGDYGCTLHTYRRHIADTMLHYQEHNTFAPILTSIFARHATEIPVRHTEREFDDSKYSFMRLINLVHDLVTYLTTTPLRTLSLLGDVIAAMGFILSILLVVLRLMLGSQWAAGGVFMLFVVLFTFIGAQFTGMGLLGEYIGRIYNDVRARPRCLVQRVVRPQTTQSAEENRA